MPVCVIPDDFLSDRAYTAIYKSNDYARGEVLFQRELSPLNAGHYEKALDQFFRINCNIIKQRVTGKGGSVVSMPAFFHGPDALRCVPFGNTFAGSPIEITRLVTVRVK